jgi:hypothetical protein
VLVEHAPCSHASPACAIAVSGSQLPRSPQVRVEPVHYIYRRDTLPAAADAALPCPALPPAAAPVPAAATLHAAVEPVPAAAGAARLDGAPPPPALAAAALVLALPPAAGRDAGTPLPAAAAVA